MKKITKIKSIFILMGIKKLLKKVKCKVFFCVSSKCSYNEENNSKFNISLNNIEDYEIIKDRETTKF